MPVRNIWLVRHGERADVVDQGWFNRKQRAYDDPPLAPLGEEQVHSFACKQDRMLQLYRRLKQGVVCVMCPLAAFTRRRTRAQCRRRQ